MNFKTRNIQILYYEHICICLYYVSKVRHKLLLSNVKNYFSRLFKTTQNAVGQARLSSKNYLTFQVKPPYFQWVFGPNAFSFSLISSTFIFIKIICINTGNYNEVLSPYNINHSCRCVCGIDTQGVRAATCRKMLAVKSTYYRFITR